MAGQISSKCSVEFQDLKSDPVADERWLYSRYLAFWPHAFRRFSLRWYILERTSFAMFSFHLAEENGLLWAASKASAYQQSQTLAPI